MARYKQIIFHPLAVLLVSIIAALIFALLIWLTFDGEMQFFLLYYFVPIGVPFVAYAFERAQKWRTIRARTWAIEVPVITLALSRGLLPVPFVSGHALFLSYAMLTCDSLVVQITALLVMFEVAYVKIFIWQDMSLVAGIVLGIAMAMLVRNQNRNQDIEV